MSINPWNPARRAPGRGGLMAVRLAFLAATVTATGGALAGCGSAPEEPPGLSSTAASQPTNDVSGTTAANPLPSDLPTDGPAPTGESKLPNPCQWISESEVTGIVGAQAVKGKDSAPEGGRACEFTWPAATATITLWQGRSHYTPDSNPAGFTNVPGIGDAAATGPFFIFRSGDLVIRVVIKGGSADHAKRIAQLVFSRMP